MCLGVPLKIIEIEDEKNAFVEMGGSKLKISIIFTPDVKVGDYVLVHAGFALRVLDKGHALEIKNLIGGFEDGKGNKITGK